MSRGYIAITAAAIVLSAVSLSSRAEAMTLPAPINIQDALRDNSLIQEAAYVCRRVWRCGPYGCGWRRICGWRPGGYYYGHRPYYGHRRYYYRRW